MATPPNPRPFANYSDGQLNSLGQAIQGRAQRHGALNKPYGAMPDDADVAAPLWAERQYRDAVAYEANRAADAAQSPGPTDAELDAADAAVIATARALLS